MLIKCKCIKYFGHVKRLLDSPNTQSFKQNLNSRKDFAHKELLHVCKKCLVKFFFYIVIVLLVNFAVLLLWSWVDLSLQYSNKFENCCHFLGTKQLKAWYSRSRFIKFKDQSLHKDVTKSWSSQNFTAVPQTAAISD